MGKKIHTKYNPNSKKSDRKKQNKGIQKIPNAGFITKPNHKMDKSEFEVYKERDFMFRDTSLTEEDKCRKRLGYNCNKDNLGIADVKLGDLKFFEGADLQPFAIIMRPQVAKELLECKKFLIKRERTTITLGSGLARPNFRCLYLGITTRGCVQFQSSSVQDFDENGKATNSFSTSFHAVLKGDIPMFLFRHDNITFGLHFNRFDENGKLTQDRFSPSKIKEMYPEGHEHNYSYRETVIFPQKKLLEHTDIVPAETYENSFVYEKDFFKKFNITDYKLKLDDDKKALSEMSKIIEVENTVRKTLVED